MKRLIYIWQKISTYRDYIYYFFYSIKKNSFPCQIIGEKLNEFNEIIILYKVRCEQTPYVLPLNKLLSNSQLIEQISPIDAVKLGNLVFEEFLLKSSKKDQYNNYLEIKSSLFKLNNLVNNVLQIEIDNADEIAGIINLIKENSFDNYHTYPCRIVGEKKSQLTKETLITFIIFGKREGFERNIKNIIKNKSLLSKFHPYDTLRLGFISSGDNYFNV